MDPMHPMKQIGQIEPAKQTGPVEPMERTGQASEIGLTKQAEQTGQIEQSEQTRPIGPTERTGQAGAIGWTEQTKQSGLIEQTEQTGQAEPVERIRTVIFDWDGTLHDTKALYGESLRATLNWLETQGYHPPANRSDDTLSRYLGINAVDMWNDYMPELPDAVKTECSRRTGAEMIHQIEIGHARMYNGAEQSLRRLRGEGYHLVILSNCKVPYMEAQRRAFDLDRYFDAYYCSGAYDFRPKEQIFPRIRDRFRGGYCMAGDRLSDRKVSLAHGIPFIGCAYGFGTPDELEGADRIAYSAAELADAVLSL